MAVRSFAQDDHYDLPLDIIDGYIVPGFRVVPDPTIDTSFANVGSVRPTTQPIRGTSTKTTVTSRYGPRHR